MTFLISLLIVLVIVLFGVFSPDLFAKAATRVLEATTTNFGWFYLIVTFGFLIFCIFLAFSKYGHIPLGQDDDDRNIPCQRGLPCCLVLAWGLGLFFGVSPSLFPTTSHPQRV
jgi:glycine betaine transporter